MGTSSLCAINMPLRNEGHAGVDDIFTQIQALDAVKIWRLFQLFFSMCFSHHVARQPCRDLHLRDAVLDDLFRVCAYDTLGCSSVYSDLLQTSTDVCVRGKQTLFHLILFPLSSSLKFF